MQYYWEIKGWEQTDKHLKDLSKRPFQRPVPFIPDQPGLYVVRGPRQIGKSTWMKLILQDHVARGHLCYYRSCEDIEDHHALTALLQSTIDRQLVILDEISFVKDWYKSIKGVLDSGDQRIFVLTGSNSVDLLMGADRMPGRFGSGGEFLLLPMEFEEFALMRKQAHWPLLSREEELELYFRVGGFPYALIESGAEGKRPIKAIQTYQSWIEGDVLKLGRQAVYLRETLIALLETVQTPVSLQTIAKKTQMGSHHTALDYIQILENSFALRTLYAMDPNEGFLRFRANKKFYFTDPLIYWAALDWSGKKSSAANLSGLAEMVAHEALRRRHPRMGFLSLAKKGEVDFFSKEESWAVEVKWTHGTSDISKAYKNADVRSKILWTKNNFLKEWP